MMTNYLTIYLFIHLNSEHEFPSWNCFLISWMAQVVDEEKLLVFVHLLQPECKCLKTSIITQLVMEF